MIQKTARYPNLTPFPRTEVAYATIPFARGEWNGQSSLRMTEEGGAPLEAVVFPFGARWDDGSVRYAAALCRLTLAPNETKVCHVVDGSHPVPDFEFSQAIFAGIGVNAPTLRIKAGGVWYGTQFGGNLIPIEANKMRHVFMSRQRLGDFVADMKYYVMSRQQLVRFELTITGSNPSNTLYSYPFEEIILEAGAVNAMNIRGMARRQVTMIDQYQRFRLMPSNGTFGDGQRQAWYGEILPALNIHDQPQILNALAAVTLPLYGMSLDWRATKAFAAFGAIPVPDSNIQTVKWNQIAQIASQLYGFMNSNGTPWDDNPLGVTKSPGQTGGQRDFGCLEGAEVLDASVAELLDAYLFMATEETKRPGHFHEMDGSPIRSANHPNWVVWSGSTHFHSGVSPDRLGKTLPNFGGNTFGWFGKDLEHHSSNLLSIAALLTGSYMLLEEVLNEVELYLAGHTLPSQKPGWSTNDKFPPRAFGRTHHAMVNHYLLTNRQDLLQRMMARFQEVVIPQWDGATRQPVRNWWHLRDDRVLGSTVDAWVPWNEVLGFMGIVALYNITHDTNVKNVMTAWGRTIMSYGWRATRNSQGQLTNVELGGGVRWFNSGEPISATQYNDPTHFVPAGGGLLLWGTPALQVISAHPEIFGEPTASLALEYRDWLRNNYYTATPQTPYTEYGRWQAIDII